VGFGRSGRRKKRKKTNFSPAAEFPLDDDRGLTSEVKRVLVLILLELLLTLGYPFDRDKSEGHLGESDVPHEIS